MIDETPLSNGHQGRFPKGYKGGPGGDRRPSKQRRLARALMSVTTPEQMERIARKWLACAEEGEPWAIKEVLARLWPATLVVDAHSTQLQVVVSYEKYKPRSDDD